jgi:hypothetical protein
MIKVTLGAVNEGEKISAMAMVSLWTNYNALQKELELMEEPFELSLTIISKDQNSMFCEFAKQISKVHRILSPSLWETLDYPPMLNGSYATYWKFDLINAVEIDEILVYLDADAFILGKFDIEVLLNRLQLTRPNSIESILMVPSHRPVFERVGYISKNNPFQYFNAGFFVAKNLKKVNFDTLKKIFEINFFDDPSRLYWHDQDLLNCYYGEDIQPLPYRYNISTGMFNKNNFSPNGMNYLSEFEFMNVVVAHASGGILFKKKHYSFRDSIVRKGQDLVSNLEHNKMMRDCVLLFLETIRTSTGRKQIHYFRAFLSKNGEKLISSIDNDFILFRVKDALRRIKS